MKTPLWRSAIGGISRRGFALARTPAAYPNRSSRPVFEVNSQRGQSFLPMKALQPTEQGFWLSRLDGHSPTEQWVDAVWLRDRCTCSDCVNPKTKQKLFSTAAIPPEQAIQSVSQLSYDSVGVEWMNDLSGHPHSSQYSLDDLWRAHFRAAVDLRTGNPMTWNKAGMDRIVSSRANTASYDDWISDDGVFGDMLKALRDFGLVFITNVPRSEKSVERLADRIGPLRHTFYGRTWDVKDKADAQNVAYTSDDLELHMDLLYMKQPPGLQLLHCIQSSGVGGVSTFSDSFKAAELLYLSEVGRDAFQTLASYPVSYHYNHPGRAFLDSKPTFEVAQIQRAHSADTSDNAKSQMPHLNNVNWSPPFQAPFTSQGKHSGGSEFRKYHKAAAAFSHVVNHPTMKFERLLRPGECVIFNNRRVLHGRTAFTSGPEERFLKGAYLDTDDFESQLRQRGFHRPGQRHAEQSQDRHTETSGSFPLKQSTPDAPR